MGRSIKDPPTFSKNKDYSRWKSQVSAWRDVVITNDFVKKATVGQVLALSLPDSAEENDIQGKLHDALGKKIGTEGGFDEIIKWLDEHLGRDEVSDTIDKIRDFMEYRRKDGQSVKEYLAGFDAKYQCAKRIAELGALPEPYLMYMVLKNAGVSDQDSKLILSGVDIKKKTELYDQVKASMLKIMVGPGNEVASAENRVGDTFFTRSPAWQPVTPYTPRFPMQGGATGGSNTGHGGGRVLVKVSEGFEDSVVKIYFFF